LTLPKLTTDEIAEQVRDAVESADLDAYRLLQDPNVHWGSPDDSAAGCRDRDEVLAWYRRGRAKGTRAHVSETLVRGDHVLFGMTLSGTSSSTPPDEKTDRWQVLTVVGGPVTDIRGFDRREDAVARLL
jgi:hypothetical protein